MPLKLAAGVRWAAIRHLCRFVVICLFFGPQVDAVLGATSQSTEKQADRIIAFSNEAKDVFDKGYYGLPSRIRANVDFYRKTWHLPGRLKMPRRKGAAEKLTPPRGLFDELEEKDLASALAGMDHALERMIGDYHQLEAYVADDTIHDDGKKGLALASKLDDGHARFMAARKTWLGIVEKKAALAESQLLASHPLQRQILTARDIFAQLGQIAEFLRADATQKDVMASLRQNLASLASKAGQPPFPAAPALERLYRAFLKNVGLYIDELDRALAEGFFETQKRRLAILAQACQKSYNDFAEAANRLSAR